MSRAKGLVLFGVATAVFGIGARAEACGAVGCNTFSDDVQPRDGSADIALNTEIRAYYFGMSPGEGGCDVNVATSVRLRSSGGEAIDLIASVVERPQALETWFVARPAALLAAEEEFELQRLTHPGSEWRDNGEAEWVTISRFRTGAAIDDQSPSFSGLTALDYGARQRGDSDCGRLDAIPATATFSAAIDATPEVRYNIYLDGLREKSYVEDLTDELFVDCGTGALHTLTFVPGRSRLEVRAIDLAGNESEPNEPTLIPALCGATEPVDGPALVSDPTVDSAAPEHAPSISRGPGCALPFHAPSAPSPTLWPLLALLLPALRRRRAREPIPGPARRT